MGDCKRGGGGVDSSVVREKKRIFFEPRVEMRLKASLASIESGLLARLILAFAVAAGVISAISAEDGVYDGKVKFLAAPKHSDSGKYYIWIEAEDANRILPSFEVDDDPLASGGKFLSHPEGTGSAWRKWTDSEGNVTIGGVGEADYVFEAPVEGDYILWGRVKWESGCSAAFYVDIDNLTSRNKEGYRQRGEQRTLGKSSTLDTWHWYSRHVFHLTKGKHTLKLSNQDDGSHIDKFLITNNFNYTPEGVVEWRTDFDTDAGKLINWKINSRSWSLEPDKDGTGKILRKTGDLAAPVYLRGILFPPSGYLSFDTDHPEGWTIRFAKPSGHKSFFIRREGGKFVFTGGEYHPKEKSGSNISGGGSNKIELFSYARHLYILMNGKGVCRIDKKNPEDFTGALSFDLANGGSLKDVSVSPIGRIHFGGNYYCHFESHQFTEREGEYHVVQDKLYSENGEAAATVGKPWWRNYQITGMLRAPEKGRMGFMFYYRDKSNYYYLALSRREAELFAIRNGARKRIAYAARKIGGRGLHRVTVNIFNGLIQVYLDGVRIIQKKNSSLFAGMAGIRQEGAKNGYYDDIEVTSISGPERSGYNEDIPFFHNHEYVQARTVLDDGTFGIGVYTPGKDRFLAKCQERITGESEKPDFEDVGFHWQTLDDDAFRDYSGDARGPGFVISQSFTDKTRLMWSVHNLYGDWELTFKLKGEVKHFGVILQEIAKRIDKAKSYVFDYSVIGATLADRRGLCGIALGTWRRSGWNQVEVKKRKKKVSFILNGENIGGYENVPEDIVLRPAITYKNGTLFIDDIYIIPHPDYLYHFECNQPYNLAISDWATNYDLHDFWGGYHSYFTLTRKDKKPVTITSKRMWKGDFRFRAMFDPGRKGQKFMNNFIVAFEGVGYPSDNIRISFSPDKIVLLNNGKLLKAYKTAYNCPFGQLMGSFPELEILRRDGYVTVFVSDKAGAQHPVIHSKVRFAESAPFKIRITGIPGIAVHTISIWGKEVKKR